MSEKYIAAGIITFLLVMFGGQALETYQKNQCRKAGMESGKSAEDIQKICK